MAVKIRLQRVGKKKNPYYRVVAVDGRKKRDGAIIENLGQYEPVSDDSAFRVKEDKVIEWLKKGAQPTLTIENLLKKAGIWQRFIDAK